MNKFFYLLQVDFHLDTEMRKNLPTLSTHLKMHRVFDFLGIQIEGGEEKGNLFTDWEGEK